MKRSGLNLQLRFQVGILVVLGIVVLMMVLLWQRQQGSQREIIDIARQSTHGLLSEQIEFADVVVVSKTDLVSLEHLGEVRAVIKALNPGAHSHAFQVPQGTEHCILLIKPDDFGQHVITGVLFDLAQIADTRLGQPALQQHAVDALDTTAHRHRRKTGQPLGLNQLPRVETLLHRAAHQRTS